MRDILRIYLVLFTLYPRITKFKSLSIRSSFPWLSLYVPVSMSKARDLKTKKPYNEES